MTNYISTIAIPEKISMENPPQMTRINFQSHLNKVTSSLVTLILRGHPGWSTNMASLYLTDICALCDAVDEKYWSILISQ